MELSEHEQRILREIEADLSASDPALVQQVSETTLYRHAARMIRWAALGFVAGLALLVAALGTLWVSVAGFLVMLACSLVIERNARKLGKAGFDHVTKSLRSGGIGGYLSEVGRRWRQRWHRPGH